MKGKLLRTIGQRILKRRAPDDQPFKVILEGILKEYVGREGGLDYAAYPVGEDDPGRAQGAADEPRVHWHVFVEWQNQQLDDSLRRFGCGRHSREQFQQWRGLVACIHHALCDLDKQFEHTGQGENVRVVFDVDMGGFFYTRITSNAVVFGATLNQAEVNNGRCDAEMRSIVQEIERVLTAHGARAGRRHN
jgi:hypothetical protein